MKKVILCAIALVFGTMAYAQVSGAPTADQTKVPANSADPDANSGISIQNGDNNAVRVRQAGEMNTVFTEQNNGSGTGGNLARVRQTGNVNGNQADSGEDNAAEVIQSGTANQSTTRQEGDFNNAYTAQGQNDDASLGNKARIRQGIANQAEANYAAIEQDGIRNQATTEQIVDNSDAWTRQLGVENKSMIEQNGAPEDTDGHSAMNYQDGARNESSIKQSGAGGRNVAEAAQMGDDNQAKQLQVTSAGEGDPGNTGIIQQGVGGPGLDFQAFGANRTAVRNLTGDSDAGNWGTTPFTAVGNKAKQVQYGEDNRAEVFQNNGPSYAEQVQAVGSKGNTATIGQGHYFNGDPENYAKQYQEGEDNNAAILSSGSGHKILQDQRGDTNEALSSQLGADHRVNIHQRGDLNSAASGQRGTGNAALIVQYDGQSYVAQQNLGSPNPFTANGGNQIDVLQLGPDGDFGDAAIDCDFEEPMNLDMDYTVPGFDLDPICPDC